MQDGRRDNRIDVDERPVPDGSSARRMDTLSHAEGKKAILKKCVSQIRAMLTCLKKAGKTDPELKPRVL